MQNNTKSIPEYYQKKTDLYNQKAEFFKKRAEVSKILSLSDDQLKIHNSNENNLKELLNDQNISDDIKEKIRNRKQVDEQALVDVLYGSSIKEEENRDKAERKNEAIDNEDEKDSTTELRNFFRKWIKDTFKSNPLKWETRLNSEGYSEEAKKFDSKKYGNITIPKSFYGVVETLGWVNRISEHEYSFAYIKENQAVIDRYEKRFFDIMSPDGRNFYYNNIKKRQHADRDAVCKDFMQWIINKEYFEKIAKRRVTKSNSVAGHKEIERLVILFGGVRSSNIDYVCLLIEAYDHYKKWDDISIGEYNEVINKIKEFEEKYFIRHNFVWKEGLDNDKHELAKLIKLFAKHIKEKHPTLEDFINIPSDQRRKMKWNSVSIASLGKQILDERWFNPKLNDSWIKLGQVIYGKKK